MAKAKSSVDVALLATVIERIDDSLQSQGFAMPSRDKAKAIAKVYRASLLKGQAPDEMVIDQVVWMIGRDA